MLPISIDQWVKEDHLACSHCDCVEHFYLGNFLLSWFCIGSA